MKPSDRDIVDNILNNPSSQQADDTREQTTRHEEWTNIIASIRAARTAEALHKNIVEGTLARLRETEPENTVLNPEWYPPARALHVTHSMCAAAVAALILMGGFLFVFAGQQDTASQSTNDSASVGKDADAHVNFTVQGNGDGSSAAPYSNMQAAIAHSQSDTTLKIAAGATTEKLRFEKRMRLEAVDGKVQIGAS